MDELDTVEEEEDFTDDVEVSADVDSWIESMLTGPVDLDW